MLEGVHAYFWGEFVFEELGVHELCADFALNEHDCFYDVVVSEKPEHGGFLVDIPHNYRLVIRPADNGLPVLGDSQTSDPILMTRVGAFTVAGADLPQSDSLVA